MIDAFENYVAVFLVLEYVQGGTLFKLQNTRPMQVMLAAIAATTTTTTAAAAAAAQTQTKIKTKTL